MTPTFLALDFNADNSPQFTPAQMIHRILTQAYDAVDQQPEATYINIDSYEVLRSEMEFLEYKEVVSKLYSSEIDVRRYRGRLFHVMRGRLTGNEIFYIPFYEQIQTITHHLFYELMPYVAEVDNLAQFIEYLSGGVAQCAQVVIRLAEPNEAQHGKQSLNLATSLSIFDGCDESLVHLPPTLAALSTCVFSQEGALVINLAPFAHFSFSQHLELYRALKMYYPSLAKKVYQHNKEWQALGERCRASILAEADLSAGLGQMNLHQQTQIMQMTLQQSTSIIYTNVSPALILRVIMRCDFSNPDKVFASLNTIPNAIMDTLFEALAKYKLKPDEQYSFMQRVLYSLAEKTFEQKKAEAIISAMARHVLAFEHETRHLIQDYFVAVMSYESEYQENVLGFMNDYQLLAILNGEETSRILASLLKQSPGVMLLLLDRFKSKSLFSTLISGFIKIDEWMLPVITAFATYHLEHCDIFLQKLMGDSDLLEFRGLFKEAIASNFKWEEHIDVGTRCIMDRANVSDDITMLASIDYCERFRLLAKNWSDMACTEEEKPVYPGSRLA